MEKSQSKTDHKRASKAIADLGAVQAAAQKISGDGRGMTGRVYAFAPSVVRRLEEIGFSRSELSQIVAPRRTLDRKIAAGTELSPHERDRVERLERVVEFAVRVFGEAETANRWLRKPSRPLGGRSPIVLLETETGANDVFELLHAIDHGVYL
jgi:putative toxin-antitoxin system antitoxin component (TIGR02293 family)